MLLFYSKLKEIMFVSPFHDFENLILSIYLILSWAENLGCFKTETKQRYIIVLKEVVFLVFLTPQLLD